MRIETNEDWNTTVVEHFEMQDSIRWSPEESITHLVSENFYTQCGIPIGNYQSGWVWGDREESTYCKECYA